MRNILYIVLVLICHVAGGQPLIKPPLPVNYKQQWPSIGQVTVSNDGNFVAYRCGNVPAGQEKSAVWDKRSGKTIDIPGASQFYFASNNKSLLYLRGQVLMRRDLRSGKELSLFSDAGSCSREGNSDWLTIKRHSDTAAITLLKMSGDQKQQRLSSVNHHYFNHGNWLFNVDVQGVALLINLQDLSYRRIGQLEGSKLLSSCMDLTGKQLAYQTETSLDHGPSKVEIWYYNIIKGGTARRILSDSSAAITGHFVLSDIPVAFSAKGSKLFFSLKKSPLVSPPASDLHIWSYQDTVLQSQQLFDLTSHRFDNYRSAYNISSGAVNRFENDSTRILYFHFSPYPSPEREADNDSLIIMTKNRGYTEPWNRLHHATILLYNLNSGKSVPIKKDWQEFQPALYFELSPKGDHLIYYDPQISHWISYQISSRTKTDISAACRTRWDAFLLDEKPGSLHAGAATRTVIRWTDNFNTVIIPDGYGDLWALDVRAKKPPVNLTRGVGKQRNQFFYFLGRDQGLLSKRKYYVLNVVDHADRRILICKLDWNRGPMFLTDKYSIAAVSPVIDKNDDQSAFILNTAAPTAFPNLFYTKNFEQLDTILSLAPEKKYNWLTSELVKWQCMDGSWSNGVLYKPEHVDPRKKYPVIFSFYDNNGDIMKQTFVNTQPNGLIDIPYYVSNGYFVFLPIVHYRSGFTAGQGALDCLVPAAVQLGKRADIDSAKMGIIGFSFGGFQTNYIISHSHQFTCAIAIAGMSNAVSEYLDNWDDNDVEQTTSNYFEWGQPRMYHPLWERPDLYLDSSPVLLADKVTTPILLAHGKSDTRVHFNNSMQFFLALRRNGKRAWLMEYEGGHGGDGDRGLLVQRQFFGHYLKNEPAPVWMTKGVPARYMGTGYGFQTDSLIKTPGTSKLLRNAAN